MHDRKSNAAPVSKLDAMLDEVEQVMAKVPRSKTARNRFTFIPDLTQPERARHRKYFDQILAMLAEIHKHGDPLGMASSLKIAYALAGQGIGKFPKELPYSWEIGGATEIEIK